jgi:serine carboxypeptidase-like clade 4
VGNGLVDPVTQYKYYSEFALHHNVVGKVTYDIMKTALPACEVAIKNCANTSAGGVAVCDAAFVLCNYSQLIPFQLTGLNQYDVRVKCAVPPLCYDFSAVDKYLNLPATKAGLGAKKSWASCNHLVNLEMALLGGDWMTSTMSDVKFILESKVNMLIYAGEYDFVCNWEGNFAWVEGMEWSGQQGWQQSANNTYLVDGEEHGSTKAFENLTFLKVKDAGHMVPLDQPKAALDMFNKFIKKQPFADERIIIA